MNLYLIIVKLFNLNIFIFIKIILFGKFHRKKGFCVFKFELLFLRNRQNSWSSCLVCKRWKKSRSEISWSKNEPYLNDLLNLSGLITKESKERQAGLSCAKLLLSLASKLGMLCLTLSDMAPGRCASAWGGAHSAQTLYFLEKCMLMAAPSIKRKLFKKTKQKNIQCILYWGQAGARYLAVRTVQYSTNTLYMFPHCLLSPIGDLCIIY